MLKSFGRLVFALVGAFGFAVASPALAQALPQGVAAVRSVEGIVFCFPHWWLSMPAVLKGYLDRVWAPGTAFVYDPNDGHLEPNLRHVRFVAVVTSFGSPWWFVRLLAGNPGRKVFRFAIEPLCARGVKTWWMALHGMDKATDEKRNSFLSRVRERFRRLPP